MLRFRENLTSRNHERNERTKNQPTNKLDDHNISVINKHQSHKTKAKYFTVKAKHKAMAPESKH